MGFLDSILNAGSQYIGGGDSPIGGLVGSIINTAGKDGWDGIVNEVTNADSGLWGSAMDVVRSEFGDGFGEIVEGAKAVASGDSNAVIGSIIGGVRDYAGPARFDEVAGAIGSAVAGDTGGWWNELSGHITTAIGHQGFSDVMTTVNDMGLGAVGDTWLQSAVGEVEELVGPTAWGHLAVVTDIHDRISDEEFEAQFGRPIAEYESDDEVDWDAILDPAPNGADNAAEQPAAEDGEILDPFDGAAEPGPGSPFGDTPLEDILEPSGNTAADAAPDSPFGDMPLEDILESSGNTGIVPPHIANASPADADTVGISADDLVGDDLVGNAVPAAPIMTTRAVPESPADSTVNNAGEATFHAAVEPPAEDSFLAVVEPAAPVATPTSFEAEVAGADDAFAETVTAIFGEEPAAEPVDDGAMTEMA